MMITGKHSKSLIFSSRFTLLSAVMFLILSLTVNAAFLSAGHKKGVAVSSEYYFTSNVLNGIGRNDALSVYPCASVTGATSLTFEIRNYNKIMVANSFDIMYKIEYCLGRQPGDRYTYSLQYESGGATRTVDVTSTEWSLLPETYTLTGNILTSQSFAAIFDCGNNAQSIDDAAPIYIKATPISPSIMKTYRLGAAITLSDTTEAFRVDGSFESISDIDDAAGFLYNMTASGVAPTNAVPQVEITWNSDVLEINKYTAGTVTYDDGPDPDTGVTYGHLIMNINSGDYFSLSFYRTDNWLAGTTPQTLQSYVTYEVLQ